MRYLFCFFLACICVWSGGACAQTTIAWTSDTSYIIFDGTSQANIIGSGTVPPGSTEIAYGKPQIEMSALVTGNAIESGVAATDGRIAATLSAMGSALATDVAAGGACAGGGILGVIGCAALSAITQAAVFLGVEKLWSWAFGSSSSTPVTITGPSQSSAPSGDYWSSSNVWTGPGVTSTDCSTDPNAVAQAIVSGLNDFYAPYVGGVAAWTQSSFTESNSTYTLAYKNTNTGQAGSLSVSLVEIASGVCQNVLAPLSGDGPFTGMATVGGAVADTPSSELTEGVAPQTTADMVNALWQQAAAKPGYAGLPYPSTDPITPSDVSTWESDNSSFAPDVGDDLGVGSGVGSQGNSGSSSSVGSLPSSGQASDGTGPATSSGTAPGTTTTGVTTMPTGSTGTGTGTGSTGASGTSTSSDTADLCAEDPTASACATLGTATAGTLPSSSVSISLSPWSIGPTNGTCPAPVSFVVFGQTLTIDYTPICTFAADVNPIVVAVCGFAAAFIIVMGFKS